MSVLRIATAGSVDDGKSTLIGRLLVDSHALLEDQLAAVRAASLRRGVSGLDLALLTDGLRAEREQGITIDVAYRYFATAKRKFILADCPGHVQYTRNMVTGASTADAALILVDAAKGLLEQTVRHTTVAGLLRVPHAVFCVNKMDLAGYSQARFAEIEREALALARRVDLAQAVVIPVSALEGDGVVERSARMPWHTGPSLLEHLESLEPRGAGDGPLRLAVQQPILPRASGQSQPYRGYAGYLAGGSVRAGDAVVHLPSGLTTTIASVELGGRALDAAAAPRSVTVRLARELDVARGDMLACPANPPVVGKELDATLCWVGDAALAVGRPYVLRHSSAEARAIVLGVDRPVGTNDFAEVRLRASRPLCYDRYKVNRATGSFILIDETTNQTVAAGMIA